MSIHPFLFAIYPILFLFAHNVSELSMQALFLPITVMLALTYFAYLILRPILKERTGTFLSIGILLFFSYRAIFDALNNIGWSGLNKTILLIYIVVLYLATKIRIKPKYFNILAFFLVAVSLFNIGSYYYGIDRVEGSTDVLGKPIKIPNIYCIILDGYGREDVLKKAYGYDNTEFLKYLENKGFHIGKDSVTLYSSTHQSMASLFNFSYLSEKELEEPMKKIRNNKVYSLLKRYEYTTVFIATTGVRFKINDADFCLASDGLTEFQAMLIDSTPLTLILKLNQFSAYERKRRNINFAFDTLKQKWKEPFFVYAHIYSPHPPYVFGPNGEPREGDENTYDSHNYIPQLKYTNKRIINLIDEIAKKNTVVILQSDHGPGQSGGHPILSASYPDTPTKISVNTFRLIFNKYLGTDYKLLEDKVR